MRFLKKLFSKKEKDQIEVVDEYAHLPKCAYCEEPIFPGDQRKTFPKGKDAKKYHAKPCFRRVMKGAKKMAQEGDVNALKYMGM